MTECVERSTVVTPDLIAPSANHHRLLHVVRLQFLLNFSAFLIPLGALVGVVAGFLLMSDPGRGSLDPSLGGLALGFFAIVGDHAVEHVFSLSQALTLSRREFLGGSYLAGLIDAAGFSVLLTILGQLERSAGGYDGSTYVIYAPSGFQDRPVAAFLTWVILAFGGFVVGTAVAAIHLRWGRWGILVTSIVAVLTIPVLFLASLLATGMVGGTVISRWFGPFVWAIPVEAILAGITYLVLRRTPA